MRQGDHLRDTGASLWTSTSKVVQTFSGRRRLGDTGDLIASVLFPGYRPTSPWSPRSTQEHASSDGGAVLLKAAERVYGLVKAFARCLADKRAPGKIRHTLADADLASGFRHGVRSSRWQRCRRTWPTTPSTSCCSGETRCPDAPSACRNPRSRDSSTARAAPCSTGPASWPRASSSRHRRRLHEKGAPDHDRLDPTDDLTHGGAAVHVRQRALCRLVLSADAGNGF